MFPGCLQDFSRMFSGCSDGSYWSGGIWWSFQMKVWTLMIQRSSMIPSYSMIPSHSMFPAIRWSPAIWWSIGSVDFDSPKVYGDIFIFDGLVYNGKVLAPNSKRRTKSVAIDLHWIPDLEPLTFCEIKVAGQKLAAVAIVKSSFLPFCFFDRPFWWGTINADINLRGAFYGTKTLAGSIKLWGHSK